MFTISNADGVYRKVSLAVENKQLSNVSRDLKHQKEFQFAYSLHLKLIIFKNKN